MIYIDNGGVRMDYSFEFERCYVESIIDIAENLGWTHSELARRAFPEKKDYRRKWRDIRGTKSVLPQKLTIADAATLARIVNKEVPEICFIVSERLKHGWTYQPPD